MSEQPHTIRLAGPWHFTLERSNKLPLILRQPLERRLDDSQLLDVTGKLVLTRLFNRPSGLTGESVVSLRVAGGLPMDKVILNGMEMVLSHDGGRNLTRALRPGQNELRLVVSFADGETMKRDAQRMLADTTVHLSIS